MKKSQQHYHKSIRKPTAPPTKVFGSIRDYSREQNYLEISSNLSDLESEKEEHGTEET